MDQANGITIPNSKSTAERLIEQQEVLRVVKLKSRNKLYWNNKVTLHKRMCANPNDVNQSCEQK